MNEYKVVVNTTPLGMSPNLDTCPPLPYELFTPEHLAFDLVYNPETTKFLRLAAEHGAATKNGLEMLHLQAIRAWEIWTK
jgi:shikimate dehydrogenase